MEDNDLSQAGYRAQFEYYDNKEAKYRRLAEEMHQKKMEALTKLKRFTKTKESNDGREI